ncbi:MAG: Smr/MutS family protein [Chitinispirillaceae bacterium]|nr:Smr/MutS family protein [Chitinispirillaceae bacterium]
MKRLHFQRLPRTVPGTAEDIFLFIKAHGVRDKDACAPAPEQARVRKAKKRKGGVLRATLDLHGLTSDEASRRLRQAVESCGGRGIKELLIIHGRGLHSGPAGRPVLRDLVGEMLDKELRLRVTRSRTGLPREGGEGATVAYLV